ncbi:MAG: hypothetical protein AWM53_01052 [Candidatus Dichloromethanomonas elyunquensis]|nr:MAG: hypothetical protein AWM53_01052 [Candidatus Dichloromethanomonas elyunquensis]
MNHLNTAVYLIFWGMILGLWLIAGKFEWIIPNCMQRNIWRIKQDHEDHLLKDAIVLNIEAGQFIQGDIEREIYLLRKSKKKQLL